MQNLSINVFFANTLAKNIDKWYHYIGWEIIVIRKQYLNRLIEAKDTEFIKVITGVRRSGKSTLLLMFKDHLLNNNVKEENIIHINFESARYDEIKNYKDLYDYVKSKLSKGKNYILLDEVQNID